MGRFFGTRDGIKRDELMGGTGVNIFNRNIAVDSDATIARGMLLCSNKTFGTYKPVSSTADASKVLVVAAENFNADSDHTVTQSYVSGMFNREKIILDSSLNIDDFEEALRKVDIRLTSIKPGTINIDNWQIGN